MKSSCIKVLSVHIQSVHTFFCLQTNKQTIVPSLPSSASLPSLRGLFPHLSLSFILPLSFGQLRLPLLLPHVPRLLRPIHLLPLLCPSFIHPRLVKRANMSVHLQSIPPFSHGGKTLKSYPPTPHTNTNAQRTVVLVHSDCKAYTQIIDF